MKKSQVASEFIFLMAFMFLIFIGFIAVTTSHMSSIKRQNDVSMIHEMMELVHTELALASMCEDGYYREFPLPSKLLNQMYTITLSPPTLDADFSDISIGYINYSFEYTESRVLPPNITGNITIGDKPITVKIKKENGVVSVNSSVEVG